ncbi:alpha/beta hydrolase [Herbaspirillum sp. WKF16]|uniref:alpha/beta fold hydrolase n=1 Tax=Herbaspirillum sp. WKF16 TaxID=3028312 RepID=UPI0023A9EF89|nr:alpha/beta hydrolase [Herbaspirillum sp. WKF16]WDZ94639.1 alpha/beta hydrolase [Herbaspirillum sp. WKF16]
MDSTTRQLADANGRQLHACLWNASISGMVRMPLVLLHDSLGAVELWRDLPQRLASGSGRQVIAYDRSGFGRSAARRASIEQSFIRDEAGAALLPLLDDLDIERAILFGHSVGGGMAIVAAAQFPDRIAAVITESAQAFVEDRTLDGIRAAGKNFEDPAQLARLAKYHGSDLEKAQWVLDAWTETWLSPEFANWSLEDDLRRVKCPVLAMHGDRDEFGSELHPKMIANLPRAFEGQGEYVMFEGCGHVPHREKPELVLETVARFLQKHFPRS